VPALSTRPVTRGVSRRTVLAGLVVGVGGALVGCTSGDGDDPAEVIDGQSGAKDDSRDPDIEVAALALSSQRATIGLLQSTARRHRQLARTLSSVTAAHQAHADLLAEAVPDDRPAASTPSPAGTSADRFSVPRSIEKALTRLVTAEDGLSTVLKRQAFEAQSGQFARLLASMAAASAQHVEVLRTAEPRSRQQGPRR
jgi:hypothetical protein